MTKAYETEDERRVAIRETNRRYMQRKRLIERQRRRCKIFLIEGLRYEGAWYYPDLEARVIRS
jgi:hypothetical protein